MVVIQRSPTFLAPGTNFMKSDFPRTGGWGGRDGFEMIQAHYIYWPFISNLMLLLNGQEIPGFAAQKIRDPWVRRFWSHIYQNTNKN